ncbi:hypothetical protein A2U01_0046242, partial [Trifolium medium]|nr:hypothetical protein [Trifolium medium]
MSLESWNEDQDHELQALDEVNEPLNGQEINHPQQEHPQENANGILPPPQNQHANANGILPANANGILPPPQNQQAAPHVAPPILPPLQNMGDWTDEEREWFDIGLALEGEGQWDMIAA